MQLSVKKSRAMFEPFEQMELTRSRNEKEVILATCNEKEKSLLELALNPYKQFHITTWDESVKDDIFYSDDDAYENFIELATYCMANNRSSDLQAQVEMFFLYCTESQKKWYSRVLKKDIKLGVQEKTINKVFKNLIPNFYVALADKAESDLSNIDFSTPKRVEFKYDGFRTVGLYGHDGVNSFIGRSGKEIVNKEFYDRLNALTDLKGKMIDGEAYSHLISFEKLSGVLRTDNEPLPEDFKFVLFDTLLLDEFMSRQSTTPLSTRILERNKIVILHPDIFEPSYGKVVTSKNEVKEFYAEALSKGYEGAMVKILSAPYSFGRNKAMLKVKPIEFVDGQIIGYYEGEGAISGKLGGFKVRLESDVEVDVGGGYKLWQREQFWQDKDKMIGSWILIKYTEITESGSLRHPNFKDVRDNKSIAT